MNRPAPRTLRAAISVFSPLEWGSGRSVEALICKSSNSNKECDMISKSDWTLDPAFSPLGGLDGY